MDVFFLITRGAPTPWPNSALKQPIEAGGMSHYQNYQVVGLFLMAQHEEHGPTIAWPFLDCWILHGMLPGPSKEVCR